jgi:acyl-CoA synthetase (AMP-forming)/AMP-acid ligase II
MDRGLTPVIPSAETRSARRDLSRRWRAAGWHGDRTLADLAIEGANSRPKTRLRFASTDHASSLHLGDLVHRARSVAGGLGKAGVSAGDRVAIQIPNWEEAALAYVAASIVGAVIVPIVHIYGPADTNWILEHARPTAFLGVSSWYGNDSASQFGAMPGLEGVKTFVIGDDRPAGTQPWADLEAASPWSGSTPCSADDPAVVIYTSGTTGVPKCVVHSHNSITAELMTMPSPPSNLDVGVALQPWPAGHIGGLTALLGPLVHGIDTIYIDRWETEEVLDLLVEEHVTAMSGVPTTLFRLLDLVEHRDVSLRLNVTTGGAGVPPALIERCEAAGWRAARCYGSSEHPSATGGRCDDSLEGRSLTDGRPLSGSEVRIVDPDGRPVPTGTPGEVELIGPEQFLGYADPEANAGSFRSDGWFRSGDVGMLDDHGHLIITDRLGDIVNRGGEKISSVEVEDILVRLDAVNEAAVIAVPDDVLGERVCAVVTLREGRTLELNDLRRHFTEAGVAKQKTPERIVVVEDFPRTPSGKVRKSELRAQIDR